MVRSIRSRDRAVITLIGLLVVASGCATRETSANSGDRDGATVKAYEALATLDARYEPVLANAFGRSTTAAFDRIPISRLNDRPYNGRRGRVIETAYSFIADVTTPADLVAKARIVVRGEVVAIGRPHFNSDDGGFWDPALHEEPGITDVSSDIYRDVLLRVDAVLGQRSVPGFTPVTPGSYMGFTSRGGQVLVTLSDEVAAQLELGAGGDYVFASSAPVDVREGEQVLLFLDYEPIDGLYQDRYGDAFTVFPASELYYKYALRKGVAINAMDPDLDIGLAELRALISEHLGSRAGPTPVPGILPKQPHSPALGGSPPSEVDEPPHGHGEG